jgi:Restriction endonuclease
MTLIDRRNETAKRCFIAARHGEWSERIAEALSERGIESFRSDQLVQSETVTEEVLWQLESADFVIASLHEGASPHLTFELGAALAWRKPTLVFTTNYDRVLDGLHSIYLVKGSPDSGGHEIGPDIDRFIRHAEKPRVARARPDRRQPPVDLTWARDQLVALVRETAESKGVAFERLIRGVFEAAGMQVVDLESRTGIRPDLIVWQNDVAYEVGGPILVECKYRMGEGANTIAMMRRAVAQMEKYIQKSDAGLGLLIVNSDRPKTALHKFDTPHVLAFDANELIDIIDRGSLADEVIQRRQKAATKLGAVIGSN